MRTTYDLSTLSWSLTGWRPYDWQMRGSMETGAGLRPEIGPLPARVPGSVQQALREAGILPDWNQGRNSRACEWVEHRHWIFTTTIPDSWVPGGGQVILDCAGLDYRGQVLLGPVDVGEFSNSFTPHTFDLSEAIEAGHRALALVFTELPGHLGQIGSTRAVRDWKPRFNYGWDFVPRLVQIGIWDSVTLHLIQGARLDEVTVGADYDHVDGIGEVTVATIVSAGADHRVEVQVRGPDIDESLELPATEPRHTVRLPRVRAWHVSGGGDRPLYDVTVRLLDPQGRQADAVTRRVGFRRVSWRSCEGAPSDAEPWVCLVNGKPVFLQGVNWVPIRPNFADLSEEDYRVRLGCYAELGVNLLRVWGGGILEREIFYDICDELGILVWQEFPLCSSGIDNWPPEDRDVVEAAASIAASYITRRRRHPSLLLWCGGNELQGAADGGDRGIGRPATIGHPMLARLAEQVTVLDPARRFVPTSASGPRFTADRSEFGLGLHHDVHGPWDQHGSWPEWTGYWDNDDALFRSEVGVPGASPVDLLTAHGYADARPWESHDPTWAHAAAWWLPPADFDFGEPPPRDLTEFVRLSQRRQARLLSYAAAAAKSRFPRCGGFIVWLGHDTYPCPMSLSLLDFRGRPKPAAHALAEVFRTSHDAFDRLAGSDPG